MLNAWNFLRYRSLSFDCAVCGNKTTPLYDFPDVALRREHKIGILRETLQCRVCFASMRQRSLALALLAHLNDRRATRFTSVAELAEAGLGGLKVLDTDNFSEISRLLRKVAGYVRCSYLPNLSWGVELEPGYFNIDLQRIDFGDACFDIVLTSDVMEHVRDCDSAHREIHRILKPGGAYAFNVPFDDSAEQDIKLVDTSTDEDVFLCAPQLHGDPLTGGVLAYRVFGRELISTLERLGFEVEFQRIECIANLVLDGDVFLAQKPI